MALKNFFQFKSTYFRFRLHLKKVIIFLLILIYASLLYNYIVKIIRKGQILEPMIKNKNSYIQTGIETNRRIAVLVLVCNRVTVTRTLDQIFKYRPNAKSFPVILSQDCGDKGKGVSSLVRQKYDEKI